MLFSIIAVVTSKPISPTEKKTRQILIVGTFDSRTSNKKKQARKAIFEKSTYKNVSKSLIDVLPEFLQADPFAKKVTQQLATRKSNLDLNIDFYK